jgi:macrolide transport system ATP-binding/permease protein
MLQDFRFAFRQLMKSKGFALTAILTLALGIGANTAIFTLIDAIMLKSLPVADPARLIRLGDGDVWHHCCVMGGYQEQFTIFSYPLYRYLRDHTHDFEEMAAFQAGHGKAGIRRTGSQIPEPFDQQFVSGNYFTMFGLRPFAGRLLAASDDVRGAAPVAVMSYRAWAQHYAADRSIIGSTFVIDGAPVTVIGIAPPGFFGDTLRSDPPDFWLPLADEPLIDGAGGLLAQTKTQWLYIIGRVRPGADLPRIEAEVNVELRQWYLVNDPPSNARARQEFESQHISLAPGGNGMAVLKENYEHDLRLLLSITGVVLLIACANLANLQLSRGASKQTQTSIRVALGASRFGLIRLMLTESVLLAFAGGAAGLVVSIELARLLMRFAFPSAQYVPIDASPSIPILAFTFLLSVITGVVFGIAPAWSASKADPAVALHGAGRSTRHTTFAQKSLVIFNVALSLVLLAAAGLMVQTLRNLQDQHFGFRVEGTAVVNVNPGFAGYAPEKLAVIYREIEQRMRQIPSVRDAGLALYSPMSGNNWQSGVTIEGRESMISPVWDRVSPAFFQTLGARALRGRLFDDHDTPASTHVAVINEAFAQRYFPNENPVGKRFGMGGVEHSADYEIAGVVNNLVMRNPRQITPPPMVFLPLLQMYAAEWSDNSKARSNQIGSILLRVDGHPPDLAAKVQRTLAEIDPNLTMLNLMTMQELVAGQMLHEHLITRLAELFGALALLLAGVGLYGSTAYSVARRTSEIGVRAALGATRPRIVRLILTGALSQVAIGLALGIPGALGAGRILADQLYFVRTFDPVILTIAIVLLASCATAAGLIPALRAASIDPVKALRVDA